MRAAGGVSADAGRAHPRAVRHAPGRSREPANARHPLKLAQRTSPSRPAAGRGLRARPPRRALIELAEDLIERTELLGALHELIGKQGQLAPSVEHKADQGRRLEKSGWRSGGPPDVSEGARRHTRTMACYLLQHRHEPRECGVVFASIKVHGHGDGAVVALDGISVGLAPAHQVVVMRSDDTLMDPSRAGPSR